MSTTPGLHTVETYPIDAIKELVVPWEIATCPLSAEARKLLLAECPVVVDMNHVSPVIRQELDEPLTFTEPRTIEGYDPETVSLRQPSNAHQRSFELHGDVFSKPWHDAHSNRYAAFTLKGNNFSNPGVMRHPTAIDEYIAWGLQESKIIERVLKASEILRERNVSTEYIVGLAEPKAYPFAKLGNETTAYDLLPLAEYRRRIVEKHWKSLPKPEQSFDKLVDMQSKFNDMTFYVSMRATDSAYRFDDLTAGHKKRRQEVYDEINKYWLLPDEEPLSADKQADWTRYVERYLARNFGQNLARLHVDLAHDFLHGLNITALGGIVDLDSVHGEPLGFGDEPIDDLDRAKDFLQAGKTLFPDNPLLQRNIKHLQESLWNFAVSYIGETNLLMNDPVASRYRIASIIARTEMFASEATGEDARIYQAICATYRDAYMDMYLRHDNEFVAQDTAFLDFFNTYKADPDDLSVFANIMNVGFLSKVSVEFIDEYIDTIQNKHFDALRTIYTCKNPIVDSIHSEVMLQLKSMFYKEWGTLAEQHMPNLLKGLDNEALETTYHAHCDKYTDQFDKLASYVAINLVSKYLDIITDLIKPEYAAPAIKGDTNYNTHETGKQLWAFTYDVSVHTALPYLEKMTSLEKVEAHTITFNKNIPVGFIEITDGKSIYEVITNTTVDSFEYQDKHLRVDIKAIPNDEVAYALVIRQDDTGAKRYELHMLKDQRQAIYDSANDGMLFGEDL